jgi:hypothetical protein
MATASEWHVLSRPGNARNTELVVRRIVQANIEHFKLLLETETDPAKRAIIIRLLAEEEAKLKEPDLKKAY